MRCIYLNFFLCRRFVRLLWFCGVIMVLVKGGVLF